MAISLIENFLELLAEGISIEPGDESVDLERSDLKTFNRLPLNIQLVVNYLGRMVSTYVVILGYK